MQGLRPCRDANIALIFSFAQAILGNNNKGRWPLLSADYFI